VTGDGRDVVGHHRVERGLVTNGRHPGRELRVPDESVTTDELAVSLSEGDELVGVAEGELAAGG
jgi:hypothetical protein